MHMEGNLKGTVQMEGNLKGTVHMGGNLKGTVQCSAHGRTILQWVLKIRCDTVGRIYIAQDRGNVELLL